MEKRSTTHPNPCNPLPPCPYCSKVLTRMEKMSIKQSHVTAFALLIHNSPSPLQPPSDPSPLPIEGSDAHGEHEHQAEPHERLD